jgi:drug/metabolite transporter, DME family
MAVPPPTPRSPTGADQSAVLRGRVLVAIAAVLWSSSGFFAKAPHFAGWPGPTLAFWRALFACVILVPMAAWQWTMERASDSRQPRWSWALVPMTLLFAAMNYTYLTAMAEGSAANAIWLQCTAPVWVFIVGVFFFGERSTGRDWALLAFVVAGVGIILAFESRGESFAAVLWGLAAGLLYAGVVLSLRQLRAFDASWLAVLNHGVTAVVLAPLALSVVGSAMGIQRVPSATAVEAREHFPEGIQWALLGAFGILQMGLPYVLFARGLRHIAGHEATGIGLLEPIIMPIWVWLVWGLAPAWWTMVGGGLILVGLSIRYAFASPTPDILPPEAVPVDEFADT